MTKEIQNSPPWQWRDLYWLLAISRATNLREAAEVCGVSAATLSRRVTALERDLKADIFHRDSRGYTPTAYGDKILDIVDRMDEVASEIGLLKETSRAVVRIAAGSWMSRFLAENIGSIQLPEDTFSLEWMTSMEKADIARRHVHIGIRNARPQEDKLAGRRLVDVAFAVYRRPGDQGNQVSNWVTVRGSVTPSSRWVVEQEGTFVTEVSEPTLVVPMVLAGKHCAVLPCFIGDSDARLERVGEVIESLRHEQWLVAHHADRNLTEVRLTIDRLAELIKDHEQLFAGKTAATD